MNFFILLSLVASLVGLCLGLIVYSFNRRATLNRLFLITVVIGFFYSFTTVMMWQSISFDSAYFWNKMGALWPFFVASVAHFAIYYTGSKGYKNKLTYLSLYIPAILFSIIEIFTDWINAPPVLKYWGYNDIPANTILYTVSTFWSALLSILAATLCLVYYRKVNDNDQKRQAKLVTIGFSIPILTFIITNMVTRQLNVEIPNLGIISTFFFVIFVGYAVFRYDLFVLDAAIASENIVSTIPDSLILTDMNGKMLKVNQRLLQFSGYSEKELINKPITLLCTDANQFLTIKDKLLEKRTISSEEIKVRTKNGTEKAVLFSGSIVKSKTWKNIGFTVVIHDITDLKKAQEEIENNKKYLEFLLESMLTGVMVIDYDTHKIIDANNTALRIMGLTAEEVKGKVCHKFICQAEKGKCPITDLGATQDSREVLLHDSQGRSVNILKNASKIVFKDKCLLVENFIDISEHKKIEQRLVKAERLASIGELARQLGHDLRNPLTGIKSGVYYLKKKGKELTEPEKEKILAAIDNAIEDSNRIINGLLDYSSDLHLKTSLCTPKLILEKSLLKVRIPERIEIEDHTSDEPQLFVDSEKIQRVFASIITNSIEAMPTNGTLEVQSNIQDSNVQFQFHDSGQGIPKKTMEKMFTPLNTTKAKGMGLSLAISKRIVEAHKGKIIIDSIEGKGTTVSVLLPIKDNIAENEKGDIVLTNIKNDNLIVNQPATK